MTEIYHMFNYIEQGVATYGLLPGSTPQRNWILSMKMVRIFGKSSAVLQYCGEKSW